MEFESYQQYWDDKAQTPESALLAVDGSSDESIVRNTGRFAADQVRAALDLQAADLALELGCGVGRIGRELLQHCRHWTGVDISEQMLDHARQRLAPANNFSLHRLTKTSLSMLDDASVDKAYAIAVLCHMDKEDLFLYLEDLHRVLKPGGLIFVDTWNLAHPIGWKRWQYEVRFWQRSEQTERKKVARNQFCTPDEFELYARQAGFQKLACYTDSHWIQLVAGKQLDDAGIRAQQQRLARAADQIAFSALFTQLFDKTVAVIYGELHPRDALAFLDQHAGCPEEALFRPFIQGIWANNTAHWGALDP